MPFTMGATPVLGRRGKTNTNTTWSILVCNLHTVGISSDDRPAIDEKAVNEWFDKYKEADKPDLMAVDGMLSFCEDLGVDPEDVITLVLSYHMQAERMMEYKREEFLAGMRSIG